MIKVAIVGAQESKWTKYQKRIAKREIRDILMLKLHFYGEVLLISGGCHLGGVDIWAEEIADELKLTKNLPIEKMIFPAEVQRWSCRDGKMGYRARNMRIAEECEVLYDIEPEGFASGGVWTAKKAEELGKQVHKINVYDFTEEEEDGGSQEEEYEEDEYDEEEDEDWDE